MGVCSFDNCIGMEGYVGGVFLLLVLVRSWFLGACWGWRRGVLLMFVSCVLGFVFVCLRLVLAVDG